MDSCSRRARCSRSACTSFSPGNDARSGPERAVFDARSATIFRLAFRPHRPAVRTRPFQGRDPGSIPGGDAIKFALAVPTRSRPRLIDAVEDVIPRIALARVETRCARAAGSPCQSVSLASRSRSSVRQSTALLEASSARSSRVSASRCRSRAVMASSSAWTGPVVTMAVVSRARSCVTALSRLSRSARCAAAMSALGRREDGSQHGGPQSTDISRIHRRQYWPRLGADRGVSTNSQRKQERAYRKRSISVQLTIEVISTLALSRGASLLIAPTAPAHCWAAQRTDK